MILPHSQFSNKLWKIAWRFRSLGNRTSLEHNVDPQKKAYSRAHEPMARGIHCSSFFFFFLPDRCVYIVKNMCVYTCIWLHRDCIWITVATNNTASEAILHTPGAVRRSDRIRIIRAPTSRWLGEYMTLDSTFYSLLFKKEVATVPSYFQIFFLFTFLEEAFISNIIIILWIHSSSYPSVFWMVGSFPSGFVASHSFHCCITVSSCVSGDLL